MCQYCENNVPCGASLEVGNEASACNAQLAESLRDAIRSFELDENSGEDDVDRCINELVERANTNACPPAADKEKHCLCHLCARLLPEKNERISHLR